MIFRILIFVVLVTCAAAQNPLTFERGFRDLRVSPDGDFMLYNQTNQPGLYLYRTSEGSSIKIAGGVGRARGAHWSLDSRYIAFKHIHKTETARMQTPMVFDTERQQLIALSDAHRRCGIPTFSEKNTVYFTIDHILYEQTLNGTVLRQFELPVYANRTPVNRQGTAVVYNDDNDQLWLLSLNDNLSEPITRGNMGYYSPQWSPDGSKILFNGFDGQLYVYQMPHQTIVNLGRGQHPSWLQNSERLIFSMPEINASGQLQNIDLWTVDIKNQQRKRLAHTEAWEDFPAPMPNS
ncbi:MAG: hypothetical protein GF313_15270, partial [Caldithrix sp.]|nr:hypothetical protein [Caldithrix sp.]